MTLQFIPPQLWSVEDNFYYNIRGMKPVGWITKTGEVIRLSDLCQPKIPPQAMEAKRIRELFEEQLDSNTVYIALLADLNLPVRWVHLQMTIGENLPELLRRIATEIENTKLFNL